MCIKYEASGRNERPIPPRDESKPSKEKLAGMTIKHITVHPNAQVAQSVEQRTENPRVGSSILSLGTNSLSSPALSQTLRQLRCSRASVAEYNP